MATWNAALATGNDAVIGSLEPGKLADIAIFAGQPGQHHRAVLEAGQRRRRSWWSWAASRCSARRTWWPAWARTARRSTCAAAPARCASSREFGVTYAGAGRRGGDRRPPAYPAFFCGVPDAEPTCVPSRPGRVHRPGQRRRRRRRRHRRRGRQLPDRVQPGAPDRRRRPGRQRRRRRGRRLRRHARSATTSTATASPTTATTARSRPTPIRPTATRDGKGDDCDFCPDAGQPEHRVRPGPATR